ncbi:hypothetical protein [Sulfurimonas sp.]|uniref:hypothetical protein n=1 Tax=Sulfurimonas sp. TaxID=2022749 RepID=UPI002AB01801|nr:hypothetical protein [Sulfurimonas sp.]
MKINDKQNELRIWIDKIGLKQKHFAELYAMDLYHEPSEDDMRIFYEKFKGHMKRDTTKIAVIDRYLDFLFTLDEFKDTSYVKPKFNFKNKLSKAFIQNMKDITKDT